MNFCASCGHSEKSHIIEHDEYKVMDPCGADGCKCGEFIFVD